MDLHFLITGFGAFRGHGSHPQVDENPSRAIALDLERAPPQRVRVRAAELPVTFEGAPRALEELEREGARPDLLLGLGVISKGGGFRLERRARGRLVGDRPDQESRTASALAIDAGPERETELELEPLAAVMRLAGAPQVAVSEDAGQYVCERCYHALLSWGERARIPALFVHVPPAHELPIARQIEIVRALVGELARLHS